MLAFLGTMLFLGSSLMRPYSGSMLSWLNLLPL